MKNIITSLVLILLIATANGQSATTSTSTSSNTSISVNNNDKSYSYTARFDNDKTDEAKKVIEKTLGNPNEETSRTALWEGKGYSVSVRQGKIEIEMDFDKITKSFRLKIEDMGDQISESIGSPKALLPPKPPKRN